MIKIATNKFPDAKIIYSSILPRQDSLQAEVNKVNTEVERYCKSSNITFLDNSHINNHFQFYDYKHLNRRGFKFFCQEFKKRNLRNKNKNVSCIDQVVQQPIYAFNA